MKIFYLGAALLLGTSSMATASSKPAPDVDYSNLEQVGQIRLLNRLDGWSRLDDDSIIVWTSPSRPFLIDLKRKSRDLRFAQAIGVTSSAGTVSERFDSIVVDGLRYPIKSIYKLDRKTAKELQSAS